MKKILLVFCFLLGFVFISGCTNQDNDDNINPSTKRSVESSQLLDELSTEIKAVFE